MRIVWYPSRQNGGENLNPSSILHPGSYIHTLLHPTFYTLYPTPYTPRRTMYRAAANPRGRRSCGRARAEWRATFGTRILKPSSSVFSSKIGAAILSLHWG